MQKKSKTYRMWVLVIACLLATASPVNAQQLKWHSFEEALTIADKSNRRVLVDVWAPWCGWCHKMSQKTYPQVEKLLTENFILTRLNRDNHDTQYSYRGQQYSAMRLAQKLHASAVPSVVILSAEGTYLFHLTGFIRAEKLRAILMKTQRITFQQ